MTSRLGLGGAYGATLDRIKGQSGEKARVSMGVLMWISHSAQPLNPDQLCHALVAVFPSVPSTLYAPPGLQSRASRASISSCRARASVLWERLSSKRVTVGPYSPRCIGNSRIVPAVLTRHLQSSPITCRARQSPTGPGRHPELPGKLMLGWNNPLPIGQSSAALCGALGGTSAWLRRGHSSLRTDGRATSIYRTTVSPELRTSMLATTRILVSKLATARVFCSLPHKLFVPYNLASIFCSLELTFFGHPRPHRHACLYLPKCPPSRPP